MKPQKDIVAEYKQRASAVGVSMHAVVKRAGLTYATWWHILKGKRSPRLSTLQAIEGSLKKYEAEFASRNKE